MAKRRTKLKLLLLRAPGQPTTPEVQSIGSSAVDDTEPGNLCNLCEVLVRQIGNVEGSNATTWLKRCVMSDLGTSIVRCALCSRFKHLKTANYSGHVELTKINKTRIIQWPVYYYDGLERYRDLDNFEFRGYIMPDTRKATSETRRGWMSDLFDNNNTFGIANRWMASCLSSHKHCTSNSTPQQYPTRLLELRDDMVYLIECRETRPSGPYVTLSHCWGDQPFPNLTRENVEQYRAGVAIAEFLPTFRHAMMTIRKLHLRYLWIDCYCIIQSTDADSVVDLQHEIFNMGPIYSNAILNIGAAYASSPRDEPSIHPGRSGIRIQSKTALEARSYLLFEKEDVRIDLKDFGSSALFKRAWCLQERLLCPRMLHLSTTTIYWECSELHLANDSFPTGLPESYKSYVGNYHQRPFAIPRVIRSKFDLTSRVPVYERFWTELVQHYSSTKLSHPNEDKFNAIGGVASHIAALIDDEYCAGFFRRSLVAQLLWSSDPTSFPSTVWRAPSWSWASIDGAVHMHTPTEGTSATLIDVDCVLADSSNMFGPLSSASLTIRGWLIEANWKPDRTTGGMYGTFYWRGSSMVLGLDRSTTHSDVFLFLTIYREKISSKKEPLYRYEYTEDWQRCSHLGCGLVLESVEDRVFKRIGAFVEQLLDPEMYRDFMKGRKTIKII